MEMKKKTNFEYMGPVTLLYAVFYAFCMYKNSSGITFPFFVAGGLLYLCFLLAKLEISFKKGSVWYMVGMMLLGVSTFATDDARIIFFNKLGVFLLMMSLLLYQFCNTESWKLGKYVACIFQLIFCSLSKWGAPFTDCKNYYKEGENRNRKAGFVILGIVIAVPLLLVVIALLGSADVLFRQWTKTLFGNISAGAVVNVLFRIVLLFLFSYGLVNYLLSGAVKEDTKDMRKGEPVLAITVTGLLTVIYLMFSLIQILGLFLGRLQLPADYTYARYAREGFFQLLAVSILNLVIVLVVLGFFRGNKVLKVILTVMSACTFIMIASSTMRMILYVRSYGLTFLRILVLWGLVVLTFLFAGVIVSIYRNTFSLFRYSMVVVTLLYIVLSFSHPDYLIAAVNTTYIAEENQDVYYLNFLNMDAAPILVPYMARQEEGYEYLNRVQDECADMTVRSYNISRHMAWRSFQKMRLR